MQANSDDQLLKLWELGVGKSAVLRSMLMLEACFPGSDADTLAQIPLGQRNRYLLEFRMARFGISFQAVSTCPRCRSQIDVGFDGDTLCRQHTQNPNEDLHLNKEGYHIKFRVPAGSDLIALGHGNDAAQSRAGLLGRCVQEAETQGRTVDARHLPEPVVRALAEAMDRADPLADIQLAMDCPQCRHQWSAPFDIAAFIWQEVDAWARQTLLEVHQLARAYGWSEDEILTMGPMRRRIYLAMLGR